jgi:hypothetical protein
MREVTEMKDKTINGFDSWEIKDAARTLIDAEKIRNDKRKNFYSTVLKELDKQVKAAEDAAVVAKTAQKLNKTFGKGV